MSPALSGGFFTTGPPGKPLYQLHIEMKYRWSLNKMDFSLWVHLYANFFQYMLLLQDPRLVESVLSRSVLSDSLRVYRCETADVEKPNIED